MKARLTLAAAALFATAAIPAVAQSEQGNQPPDFTPENVTPENPFGGIDVTGAGDTVGEIYAFAAGLNGGDLIELLRRCHVIHPLTVTAQTLVDVDTMDGDDEMADGEAGDVAGDEEPPPMPAGDLVGAADLYYDEAHVTLCENLQGIILAIDFTDPMDAETDDGA